MERSDGDDMLAQSCGPIGAEIRESTIEHNIAGMGCLVLEHFWDANGDQILQW